MPSPAGLAKSILADQGIWGDLLPLAAGRWQYRGTKGKSGVAVEIEGEPDEAIIREAAGQIVAALAQ